jgi:hypothetical protein
VLATNTAHQQVLVHLHVAIKVRQVCCPVQGCPPRLDVPLVHVSAVVQQMVGLRAPQRAGGWEGGGVCQGNSKPLAEIASQNSLSAVPGYSEAQVARLDLILSGSRERHCAADRGPRAGERQERSRQPSCAGRVQPTFTHRESETFTP